MSNISVPSNPSQAVATDFVVDRLCSNYLIAAHSPYMGCAFKVRTTVRNEAFARFEELRDSVTSDVAIILWLSEEDHLVDSALKRLVTRVSYPVATGLLRESAHWEGNPPFQTFHERLSRFVQSIIAQTTCGGDHAGTV